MVTVQQSTHHLPLGRVFIRRNLFMVYVISKKGKPLMPCKNVIARLLLKQGKAKVRRREPFIIKLTVETTNYLQNLTLGVDTGSGTAGPWVWMKGCLSTAGRYMVLISGRFQKRTGAVALFPLIRLFPIRTVSLLLLLMCRLP